MTTSSPASRTIADGREDGEHLGDALGQIVFGMQIGKASRERSLKRNASMPAMPSPRPTMPVRTATIKEIHVTKLRRSLLGGRTGFTR